MATDPINRVSSAMQILRRSLGQSGAAARAAPTSDGGGAGQGAAPSGGTVREAIASRLRSLDPAEPHYGQRATEAFVEGILLDEFGTGMTNDAKFRQVILGVAREMRSEPETARELDQLFRTLREG